VASTLAPSSELFRPPLLFLVLLYQNTLFNSSLILS
jgi:hypothetical protein